MWIEQTSEARFWLAVMNEPESRDAGREGYSDRGGGRTEGLRAGHRVGVSRDRVQTCILHLVRASLAQVLNRGRQPPRVGAEPVRAASNH